MVPSTHRRRFGRADSSGRSFSVVPLPRPRVISGGLLWGGVRREGASTRPPRAVARRRSAPEGIDDLRAVSSRGIIGDDDQTDQARGRAEVR